MGELTAEAPWNQSMASEGRAEGAGKAAGREGQGVGRPTSHSMRNTAQTVRLHTSTTSKKNMPRPVGQTRSSVGARAWNMWPWMRVPCQTLRLSCVVDLARPYDAMARERAHLYRHYYHGTTYYGTTYYGTTYHGTTYFAPPSMAPLTMALLTMAPPTMATLTMALLTMGPLTMALLTMAAREHLCREPPRRRTASI